MRRSTAAVRGFVMASALAGSLAAREVHAQSAEADALVAHGIQLRQAGNDDEALTEFRHAYELQHSPRTLAQIALAEQAVGHWVDADAHLREALAATTDPWIARNAGVLQNALSVIGRHLGSLDVRSNVAGAELWVNGERAGTLPLTSPVRVLVGSADVEVRAPGHRTVHRVVDVSSGILSRETVNLIASAQAEPGDATAATTTTTTTTQSALAPTAGAGPRDTASAGAPVGPIALMGLGVLGLAGAGAFYALRGSAIGNCTQITIRGESALSCPTQADANRAGTGGTYTTLTNAFLIGGGVALAAGVVWLIVHYAGGNDSRGAASPPPRASVDVMPLQGGVFVGLSGSL